MYRWMEAVTSSANLPPSPLLAELGDGNTVAHAGQLTITEQAIGTATPLTNLGRHVYILKGEHFLEKKSRRKLFSLSTVVAVSVKNPPELPGSMAAAPMSRLSAAALCSSLLHYGIQVDVNGDNGSFRRLFLQPDTPGELEAWVEAFDGVLLQIGRSELMIPVDDSDSVVSDPSNAQPSNPDLVADPKDDAEDDDLELASGSVPLRRSSPLRLSIRGRSGRAYSMAYPSEGSPGENDLYDGDGPTKEGVYSPQGRSAEEEEDAVGAELLSLTGKAVASWLQGASSFDEPYEEEDTIALEIADDDSGLTPLASPLAQTVEPPVISESSKAISSPPELPSPKRPPSDPTTPVHTVSERPSQQAKEESSPEKRANDEDETATNP